MLLFCLDFAYLGLQFSPKSMKYFKSPCFQICIMINGVICTPFNIVSLDQTNWHFVRVNISGDLHGNLLLLGGPKLKVHDDNCAFSPIYGVAFLKINFYMH